jgi:hypothetical protein
LIKEQSARRKKIQITPSRIEIRPTTKHMLYLTLGKLDPQKKKKRPVRPMSSFYIGWKWEDEDLILGGTTPRSDKDIWTTAC